jgi:hypothetical protein
LREFWGSVGLSRRFAINDPNQLGPTGTAAAQAKTKIQIIVKDTFAFPRRQSQRVEVAFLRCAFKVPVLDERRS